MAKAKSSRTLSTHDRKVREIARTLEKQGYKVRADVRGRQKPKPIAKKFVPDIEATCAGLAKEGVKIPRPPGPMKHGTTVIAFVEDPDGYKVELIERK